MIRHTKPSIEAGFKDRRASSIHITLFSPDPPQALLKQGRRIGATSHNGAHHVSTQVWRHILRLPFESRGAKQVGERLVPVIITRGDYRDVVEVVLDIHRKFAHSPCMPETDCYSGRIWRQSEDIEPSEDFSGGMPDLTDSIAARSAPSPLSGSSFDGIAKKDR